MSIIIGRYIKIYNIIIITSVCDCDAVKNGSIARPNETIINIIICVKIEIIIYLIISFYIIIINAFACRPHIIIIYVHVYFTVSRIRCRAVRPVGNNIIVPKYNNIYSLPLSLTFRNRIILTILLLLSRALCII